MSCAEARQARLLLLSLLEGALVCMRMVGRLLQKVVERGSATEPIFSRTKGKQVLSTTMARAGSSKSFLSTPPR